MEAYGLTDIGMVRSMNQDFVFASPKKIGPLENLFLVADGMGGHKAGDYASRFMIRRLVRFLQKYMPGFERSFIMLSAPQLGTSGGRRVGGADLSPLDAAQRRGESVGKASPDGRPVPPGLQDSQPQLPLVSHRPGTPEPLPRQDAPGVEPGVQSLPLRSQLSQRPAAVQQRKLVHGPASS